MHLRGDWIELLCVKGTFWSRRSRSVRFILWWWYGRQVSCFIFSPHLTQICTLSVDKYADISIIDTFDTPLSHVGLINTFKMLNRQFNIHFQGGPEITSFPWFLRQLNLLSQAGCGLPTFDLSATAVSGQPSFYEPCCLGDETLNMTITWWLPA